MSTAIERSLAGMSPEAIQAGVAEVVAMVASRIEPGRRNLVYILSQSGRFGHFGLETQIIRSMYQDQYDRIVIVTGLLDEPGTNPWIPHCAGPAISYVHTGSAAVLLLGMVDLGVRKFKLFDILFAQPRRLFIDFYRSVIGGSPVRPLELPQIVEDRARANLGRLGIDPDEPFVFFHNRTLQYRPGMSYHGHRTADVTSYRDSLAALISAGYRVVRIGEPGMDRMDLDPSKYVNLPDFDDRDPATDLFVCARCQFGMAQNSGPIWVVAAFGNPVLRTNAPFEHLNLPYRGDITLFKHYRRIGSDIRLRYREILDARLPSLFQDPDIEAAGYELVPNEPDELLAACEEQLQRVRGQWAPDMQRQQRFWDLGAAYEQILRCDATMVAQTLDFYGYAHPFGFISQAFLDANPDFLT